uniref:Uncharacterized protein n=1 Tax=Anopheles atroparvus TaxID=41427 RepID=A0A182J6J5_ANOAO
MAEPSRAARPAGIDNEPGDEGVERPAGKDVLSSGSVSPSSSSTPPPAVPVRLPPPAPSPEVTHDGPATRSSSGSASVASPPSSASSSLSRSPSISPRTKSRRPRTQTQAGSSPGADAPEVIERIPEPTATPAQLIDSHDDVERSIPATLIHDPAGLVHQPRQNIFRPSTQLQCSASHLHLHQSGSLRTVNYFTIVPWDGASASAVCQLARKPPSPGRFGRLPGCDTFPRSAMALREFPGAPPYEHRSLAMARSRTRHEFEFTLRTQHHCTTSRKQPD